MQNIVMKNRKNRILRFKRKEFILLFLVYFFTSIKNLIYTQYNTKQKSKTE